MPHIWFPNFPLSLPALPSAPLHRDVRTLFCFFREGGGEDVWWVMALNTGHQHFSLFLCLCFSSSPSVCSSIALSLSSYFLQSLAIKYYRGGQGYVYEEDEEKRRFFLSPLLCPHSSTLLCLGLSSRASTSAEQKLWRSPPPHSFPYIFPSHYFVSKHKFVIFGAVTQNWKAKAKPRKGDKWRKFSGFAAD